MKTRKTFTLVELIIVIAIIAILAVTAFLLLTKRLAKARDASRSSNLANIENSLQISLTENSSLPKPDSYVLIYASGTTNVVGYQGYFGEGVKDSVGNINSAPKDGDDYFTYYLNADLNKYQLGAFMENEIAYNPNVVSAVDYASRYVNVRGNKLGLLTDSNKSPLQSLGMTGLDLLTGTASYIAYFSNSDNVAGTGKQLFTYYYNQTKSLLQKPEFAKNDDSLVGYWDMSTLTGALLADLSIYGNNGTCFSGVNEVSCGGAGGPQIIDGEMKFDGIDDYIKINKGIISPEEGTILAISKSYVSGIMIWAGDTGDGYGGESELNMERDFYFGSKNINGNGYRLYNRGLPDDKFSLSIYKNNGYVKYYQGDKYNTTNVPLEIKYDGRKDYIYIGRPYGATRYLNGTVDEVRIYNRVLSDNEVQALYNATK